jgi:general secretion pathway protein G
MQATLERLRQRREDGDEGGFTLIELLIVIVILAILAAIVVFAVQNLTGSSAKASCQSDVSTVDHAVQSYVAQVGTPPAAVSDLMTSTLGVDGTNSVGPWLHNLPTNGNHYAITLTTDSNGAAVGTPADKAGAIIVNSTWVTSKFTVATSFTTAADVTPAATAAKACATVG